MKGKRCAAGIILSVTVIFITAIIPLFTQTLGICFGEVVPELVTEGNIAEKLTKGDSVIVPEAKLQGGQALSGINIKLFYREDGAESYLFEKDLASGENITFSKAGFYCVKFEAETDSGIDKKPYYAQKIFYTQIKEIWLVVDMPENLPQTIELNKEYPLPSPFVKDIKGQAAEGAKVNVKVLYGGTEIAVSNGIFTPKLEGEYKIVYYAEIGGEKSDEVSFSVYSQKNEKAPEGCGCGATGFADGGSISFLIIGILVLLFINIKKAAGEQL